VFCNRENFNLNPSQQELLKWHCRWCHCDFNRVRMILSRPRQPKHSAESGEIVPQIVIPSESGTSNCEAFCCTACLYAKQKRKTADSSTEIRNSLKVLLQRMIFILGMLSPVTNTCLPPKDI
jgi:hypothetical protein